ncbi:hypothetical protein [Clostridium sp. 3-3]|uniref:hypothetical protein n=1 Tax=Clostridium sp. 3-3 TaxID=2070757 RepID=UPI000CDA09B5|nr:hypothetical protein [Clostridium sp. 3-3]POO87881.1 hypothetical protein C1H59_03700 [Clostridium sp. 3-3]
MENIEQKSLEQIASEKFQQLAFANLKKNIVQDLINNRNESVIYRKYDKERVVKMLENPQASEKELRNMSNFLYIVSSHYRRLINYYASLPKYNYTIIPTNLPSKVEKKKYRETYNQVCNLYKKYNLKHECLKIMQSVFRDGVFYGLTYETTDSFYIRPFNPDFAKISSIEDGTCTLSIDLNYFISNEIFLSEYGTEIETAFYKYKGNKKTGTKGNSSLRWYEPSNGICIKADENDLVHSVPIFIGLILGVLDIEDYKLLKKAKKEIDNYKVLAMKMDTDENGVPKMEYDLAIKYYNQASANIPDGIGLILSPFTISDFTFQSSSTAESDAANEAEEDFWFGSGTSPLLFGSSKNTSSSSLNLSIKPDESISFAVLEQIQRFFNKKIKKMDLAYSFEMKFLEQSIFNEKTVQDTYLKAGQYGVSGAKLLYANSIGLEPSDINGMAYLEDDILGVGTKIYKRPLISSNTLSNGKTGDSENSAGKPTAEESGTELGEAGEKTRELGSNENR